MAKKILYYSSDKLYKINKNKKQRIQKVNITTLCVFLTILLIIITTVLFSKSVVIGSDNSSSKYNEIGSVDYKVYLKDNDFYESSFLGSGMQYVANLIKTVNVKFNYELHATDDLDFVNEYKVVSELQITEKDDPSSVLYSKKEDIIPTKKISMQGDNLVINEEIDIDYDKYNNIVNTYKSNLGLIVSSNLILTFETNTNATNENDKLAKDNKLQIVIPLSESTLKINMNTEKINNTAPLSETGKMFNVENTLLFILAIISLILTIGIIIVDIYIYWKYLEKDPYKTKLNNILKNYDRLIVTGNMSVNESKYSNIIYASTFKELVDAAENLGVPIMYYEVIKGEKSIFIVSKEDTLVKYRVTKAYLNNPKNKDIKLN